MSNETKTRERFIILLPGFCYYCLGSNFLTSHVYTNVQLRYSSAIAPYTSLYPLQLLLNAIAALCIKVKDQMKGTRGHGLYY
jgi:hypothetical protein